MNKQELFENIKKKKSFLCVGLDTDIKKIPEHLLKEEDPIFTFNKAIIDATAPYCIAILTSSLLPMPNVAISVTLRLCMPALSLKN